MYCVGLSINIDTVLRMFLAGSWTQAYWADLWGCSEGSPQESNMPTWPQQVSSPQLELASGSKGSLLKAPGKPLLQQLHSRPWCHASFCFKMWRSKRHWLTMWKCTTSVSRARPSGNENFLAVYHVLTFNCLTNWSCSCIWRQPTISPSQTGCLVVRPCCCYY